MGGGPVFYGHEEIPESPKTQVVVAESSYGIWREQVYQLAVDFATLFELRNRLDPTSLRVSEIDRGAWVQLMCLGCADAECSLLILSSS